MNEHSPRGGSFLRDPETGKLTLVEETLPEAPAEEAEPSAETGKKAKKSANDPAATETEGNA